MNVCSEYTLSSSNVCDFSQIFPFTVKLYTTHFAQLELSMHNIKILTSLTPSCSYKILLTGQITAAVPQAKKCLIYKKGESQLKSEILMEF